LWSHNVDYEELCVLGEPAGIELVFHFPPVSCMIRTFGKPIVLLAACFHAGFLLGLFLDPEDGSDMFLRNAR
jgi:hypothetical protein